MTRFREYFQNKKEMSRLILLLLAVAVVFAVLKPSLFLKVSTLESIVSQFPEYGVMALGLMLCFISGGIDLSFVAVGNFAAIIAVKTMLAIGGDGFGTVAAAILVGLAAGALAGLINGLLISKTGIPAILATLATQQVFSGLSKVLTKGRAISGLPAIYSELGHRNLLGFLPVPLLVFLLCFVAVAFLLNRTVYGANLFMLGANAKTAKFSAMNCDRMICVTFMLAGVFAAVGGLLMVSTYNSAKPDYGSSYLMQCILILVLAGVSTSGGSGRIANVLIAVLTVQIISTGVNMFAEINTYYRSLFWGLLLLLMMIANYVQGHRPFPKLKAVKPGIKPV